MNEAKHAGYGSKEDVPIVAFPLYADRLVEKSRANMPCKSHESASTGKLKSRPITDEMERNLHRKYDGDKDIKDILADLESALSALGAMEKLGCCYTTSAMTYDSPIVHTCNLAKPTIAPSPYSILKCSQAGKSAVVSDSSASRIEREGAGGAAGSPPEQDEEVMSYDGEEEQNCWNDYESGEEDGQTDQESPFPYQAPEAVGLLWRPKDLWSVLRGFGWERREGKNKTGFLYYCPMMKGEPFASFKDVVSFCAMNIHHSGDGMSLWRSNTSCPADICTNQKRFLLWGTLLMRLRIAGWITEYHNTQLTGPLCTEAYLRPGVDPEDKDLVLNLHYFRDQEMVKAFVCKHWDNPRAWLGHYKDVEGLEAITISNRRRSSSSNPATLTSESMRNAESKDSVLSLPRTEVSSLKHKLHCEKQKSPRKRSVFFSWPWDKVWERLTRRGSTRFPVWTCRYGAQGMGHVYFRPGCDKVIASLTKGTHYFTSQQAVRVFCADHESGDKFMEPGLSSNWAILWERLKFYGWKCIWGKKKMIGGLSGYEDWYLRPCEDAPANGYWDDQFAARLGLRKNLHYFTTKVAVEDFMRINSDSSDKLEMGDYTMPAVSADGDACVYNNEKTLVTPKGKAAPYVSAKRRNNNTPMTTVHSKSFTNHETHHRLTPSPFKKEVGNSPTACSNRKISNNNSQQRVAKESLLQQLDSPAPSVNRRASSQNMKTVKKNPNIRSTCRFLLHRGWFEEEEEEGGGKVLVRPHCGTGYGWILGLDYFYLNDEEQLLEIFLEKTPELLLKENQLADALRKKGWESSAPPHKWIHPSGAEHLGEGTFDSFEAVEAHIHRFPIVLCGENDEVELLEWLRARGWEEDEAPSEDGSGKLRRNYQLLSRSEVYRLARIKPADVALPMVVDGEGHASQMQGSPNVVDSPNSTTSLTCSQGITPLKAELRLNGSTHPQTSQENVGVSSSMVKKQLYKKQKTLPSSNSPQLSISYNNRTNSSWGNPPEKGQSSCQVDPMMKTAAPLFSIEGSSVGVKRRAEMTVIEDDVELSAELLDRGWKKCEGEAWVSPRGDNTLSSLDAVRHHLQLRPQSLELLQRANDALQLGCKCVDEKNFMKTRMEYEELKNYIVRSAKERRGGSILLSGIAGSGKTLAVSILEEELEMMKEKPFKLSPVGLHIQGTASVSRKAIFQDLCDQLERKGGGSGEDFYTSSAEEHLIKELHANLSSAQATEMPMVIIIVDEIDYLDSSVIRDLFAWAHSESRLILVGITNNVNFPNEPVMEFQRNRGWKSEHIVFPPYGYNSLLQILKYRAGFAAEEKAIEHCAKWATNSGCGSARLALTLLLKAVGLAKADARECVHSERLSHPVQVMHTRHAVQAFKNAGLPTVENIKNLPTRIKAALCAAAQTAVDSRHRRAPTSSTLHPDQSVEIESLVLSAEDMERGVFKIMEEKFGEIMTASKYSDALQYLENSALIKKERGGSSRHGSTNGIGLSPRPKSDNIEILVPVYLIKQAVSDNLTYSSILTTKS